MSEDVEAVKLALRKLVDGAERRDRNELETLVERAEHAVEDVRDAAEFDDSGGFTALESAVTGADSDADRTTTERARTVLEAVAEYRAIAADHFRPGREGLMGGDPVSSDETT